ncbi:MAG: Hsp20/alpha crystallin family protein [Roseibium sp.]
MTEASAELQGQPEATREALTYAPLADIYETKDSLVVLAEMPGVDPEDVDLSVENRVLTITGHATAADPQGFTLAHGEYRSADFRRSFALSEEVDSAKIDASMKDGVLRLVIPKRGPAPARKIVVKRGD